MKNLSNTAIVMGGSIAGILAARVLSDFFKEVIIIEKDEKSSFSKKRKSIPQGSHLHVLLDGGLKVFDELFPNFSKDLKSKGSIIVDSQNDVAWYHFGVWKTRYISKLKASFQSRPFLEHHLRNRLLEQCQNIKLLDSTNITGLNYDSKKDRIIGVKIENNKIINANFIIDATGRTSSNYKWLKEHDLETPYEEKIKIGMGYTSMLFKPKQEYLKNCNWKALFVYPYAPYNTKYGAVIPIEKDKNGDRYMVALSGALEDHASRDKEGFLNHAKLLANDKIYQFIKNSSSISDFSYFKSPENIRRYYEKLSNPPKGIISIGDTIAVVNPIYGQGMTVIAYEAKALQKSLKQGLKNIETRYYKEITPTINIAWDVTSGEDFRYPQVRGKRSLKLKFQNIYSKHLFILSGSNRNVWHDFAQVLHFIKHPLNIFRPHMVFNVIKSIIFKDTEYKGKK